VLKKPAPLLYHYLPRNEVKEKRAIKSEIEKNVTKNKAFLRLFLKMAHFYDYILSVTLLLDLVLSYAFCLTYTLDR
jgi:hypothetical protein